MNQTATGFEQEPTGAVQTSTCTWELHRLNADYYRVSCEKHIWPVQWAGGSWKYCPWCGKPIEIVEAAA